MATTISGDNGIDKVASGAVDLTTDVTGVLPQAQGGTGDTSLPAGGFSNIEIFASSTTWTVPSGITKARVTVIGAGGGGGGSSGGGGGYGGLGGLAVAQLTGLSGSVTITIGTGGTGSNSGAGTAGGTSSFGSAVSATGGGGGALNSGYARAASGAGTVSSGTALRVVPSSILNERYNFPSIINGMERQPGTSLTSPVAYSSTGLFCAGAGGAPESGSTSNDAAGGVGGVVIVEY